MEPLPSTEKIFSFVKQEEAQKYLNNSAVPLVDSAALNRKSFDHRSSRFGITAKRQRPFCDNCTRYGHTRTTSYRIHGFPDRSSTPANNNSNNPDRHVSSVNAVTPSATSFTAEQYSRLLALINPPEDNTARVNLASNNNFLSGNLIFNSQPILNESIWYIDSGATHHISCDINFFSSYQAITNPIKVQLPDGSFANVQHIGTVNFSPHFILQNVYHIPTFLHSH